MSISDKVKAAIVDVIRGLWDRGLQRDNKILKQVHDHWFGYWVDWKTSLTMLSVDDQIEDLLDEWDWTDDDGEAVIDMYDDWVTVDEVEGETPLGGELRVRAPWKGREGP